MRNRTVFRSMASTLLTALGGLALIGCGGQTTTSDPATSSNEALAAIVACGLDDGSIEPDAHLHACDPQDVKKTTICHIPPGNPANAHTICVGNAAVSHHVKNHGDLIGPCQVETPCPPPPPSCDESHGKGKGHDDGAGGACSPGTGGTSGTGGASGSGGMSGAGGAPAPMCPEGQLDCSTDPTVCSPEVTYCNNGCCIPVMPV